MTPSRFSRSSVAALLAFLFAGFMAYPLMAQPSQPNSQDGAARNAQAEVYRQFQAACGEYSKLINSEPIFTSDEAQRARIAPKVIPVLNRLLAAFNRVAEIDPDTKKQSAPVRCSFMAMLSVYGDAPATAALNAAARQTGNSSEAMTARTSLLIAQWMKAGASESAQLKVLDEAQALAQSAPTDESIMILFTIIGQTQTAGSAVRKRVESIIAHDLKIAAAQKTMNIDPMDSLDGKPLTLEGATLTGEKFSTAAWKGKVILVDFWATWCGPCLAELPRVKKAYADYHAKGLEVLGVSCDQNAGDLEAFLQKDPAMTWPQLFDAQANPSLRWHPLAKQYGIAGIPTMFLIDKAGILHSVTARKNFEELIPKLLNEKAR